MEQNEWDSVWSIARHVNEVNGEVLDGSSVLGISSSEVTLKHMQQNLGTVDAYVFI